MSINTEVKYDIDLMQDFVNITNNFFYPNRDNPSCQNGYVYMFFHNAFITFRDEYYMDMIKLLYSDIAAIRLTCEEDKIKKEVTTILENIRTYYETDYKLRNDKSRNNDFFSSFVKVLLFNINNLSKTLNKIYEEDTDKIIKHENKKFIDLLHEVINFIISKLKECLFNQSGFSSPTRSDSSSIRSDSSSNRSDSSSPTRSDSSSPTRSDSSSNRSDSSSEEIPITKIQKEIAEKLLKWIGGKKEERRKKPIPKL